MADQNAEGPPQEVPTVVPLRSETEEGNHGLQPLAYQQHVPLPAPAGVGIQAGVGVQAVGLDLTLGLPNPFIEDNQEGNPPQQVEIHPLVDVNQPQPEPIPFQEVPTVVTGFIPLRSQNEEGNLQPLAFQQHVPLPAPAGFGIQAGVGIQAVVLDLTLGPPNPFMEDNQEEIDVNQPQQEPIPLIHWRFFGDARENLVFLSGQIQAVSGLMNCTACNGVSYWTYDLLTSFESLRDDLYTLRNLVHQNRHVPPNLQHPLGNYSIRQRLQCGLCPSRELVPVIANEVEEANYLFLLLSKLLRFLSAAHLDYILRSIGIDFRSHYTVDRKKKRARLFRAYFGLARVLTPADPQFVIQWH